MAARQFMQTGSGGAACLFKRLAETGRAPVRFWLDGQPAEALVGDTLLTAVLTQARRVRVSEFGGGPRAGFCLMGACQDCWIQMEDGQRVRACSNFVQAGMRLRTVPFGNVGGGDEAGSGSGTDSSNDAGRAAAWPEAEQV